MGVDEIITLDDGKEYILLSQTVLNNEKFFLAVEAINNEPSEKYALFKEIVENGALSVEEVEDNELKDQLIDQLEEDYINED